MHQPLASDGVTFIRVCPNTEHGASERGFSDVGEQQQLPRSDTHFSNEEEYCLHTDCAHRHWKEKLTGFVLWFLEGKGTFWLS